MEIRSITGGVCAARGFKAAATAAGIRHGGRDDMAMIACDVPCVVAGTFTSNVVKAAPVQWDMKVVMKARAQAVVVNSGLANACTGRDGMECCEAEALAMSETLGIPADSALIGSTGVIGAPMPVEKLVNGIHALSAKLEHSEAAAEAAARAIMTTDTRVKQAAVELEIHGRTVHIGGMTKGSGMIHPNMCTMLAYVTTDALINRSCLERAAHAVIEDTFNMISVDGDTSTNDTFLVLASGLAENPRIEVGGIDYDLFCRGLHAVCEDLARQMAADGEGAHKSVTVTVDGATGVQAARTLARSVVSSNLVKTAMAGSDANWGRVLCALGYSGAEFSPDLVCVEFSSSEGSISVCEHGSPVDFDEDRARRILDTDAVEIHCHMGLGSAAATAYGCDLTHEYININADYRS